MLKLVALVALFAGFCWFGTQVPLGPHTLFGHLHAIAGTRESQDLFDGTRASARPLVDDVRRRIAGVPAPAKDPGSEPAKEPVNETGKESGSATRADSQTGSTNDETDRVAAHRRPDGGPPQETLTASERRRLRRLISSAEGASARR